MSLAKHHVEKPEVWETVEVDDGESVHCTSLTTGEVRVLSKDEFKERFETEKQHKARYESNNAPEPANPPVQRSVV